MKKNIMKRSPLKKRVVARLFIKTEKRDVFLKHARLLVKKTRAEEGCLFYSLYQDKTDPDAFLFYEEYVDQKALDTHFHSPHLQVFRQLTRNMHAKDRIVEVF